MAMYLYEAIAEFLRAGGNISMIIGDIAVSTNSKGPFFSKGRSPIDVE